MVKVRFKSKGIKPSLRWHAAPLKGSFMALAIVGFLVSTYLVFPLYKSLSVAFMIIFTAMFIASLVSMTKAPIQ